jgi:isoleucyl-tRNA synthetase
MRGMLESRPDWCISRQRAWGLPIPAFFTPEGHCLMTAASVRAVAKLFREQGSDAWFTKDATELLKHYDWKSDAELREKHPDAHAFFTNAESRMPNAAFASLRKGNDILDVWFESGSSWNAVMRERNLGYPIDLYLEGSDQHRGWFQLSLLPALGVTGRPPFKTLLTHGFMVDRDGKKLSKSRPDAHRYEVDSLCTEFGMDVMRWWVASLAYENDVKVDVELFALAGESYRKVRNTLRFMLSNLYDFDCSKPGATGHCVDLKALPATSIDRWILAEFDQLAADVVAAYNKYDFQTAQKELFNFCNDRLSATYLAAVKDRLYCDKPDSPRRRATQTALWDLTDGLCKLLAPILPHTADEAFRALLKVDANETTTSVHLKTFPAPRGIAPYPGWDDVFKWQSNALSVIEAEKKHGLIDRLNAAVFVGPSGGARQKLSKFDPIDLADLIGVSRVELRDVDVEFTSGSEGTQTNVGIFHGSNPDGTHTQLNEIGWPMQAINLADQRWSDRYPRCERSWKRDGTVKQRSDGGLLSDRDAEAVMWHESTRSGTGVPPATLG